MAEKQTKPALPPPSQTAQLVRRVNALEHFVKLQQEQIVALSERFALYWREETARPSLAIVLVKHTDGKHADLLVIGDDWSGGMTMLLNKSVVGLMDDSKKGKYEPLVVPMELLKAAAAVRQAPEAAEPEDGNSALADECADTSSDTTPALIP